MNTMPGYSTLPLPIASPTDFVSVVELVVLYYVLGPQFLEEQSVWGFKFLAAP